MRYFLFCFFLFAFSLSGCKQKNITSDVLIRVEWLMDSDFDKAYGLLNEMLPEYEEMNETDRAKFGFLYTWARDIIENQAPVEYIDYSIDYYQRNGQKSEQANALLYKSRIYLAQREDEKAMKYLFQSQKLAEEKHEYNILGKIYYDYGTLASYKPDYPEMLVYFTQSAEYFGLAENKKNQDRVLGYLSLIHQSMGNYADALKISRKALAEAQDSVSIGLWKNSIGLSYMMANQLDSALYYMLNSLQYPAVAQHRATRHTFVGDIYLMLNQKDSMENHMLKALESDLQIHEQNDVYQKLIDLYLERDDKEKTAYYISKQRACQDSLKKLYMSPPLETLKTINKVNDENTKIQAQHTKLIILILLIPVCALLIIYNLYRKKKREEKISNQYKEELAKIRQELNVRNINNEIEKNRVKYAPELKKVLPYEREVVERKIFKDSIPVDDEKAFGNLMNKALNNLPDKLINEYPSITYREMVFCCLYMIDLHTNDICLLLDMTVSTQYKFKQRLAKKMQLSSTKELERKIVSLSTSGSVS